MTQLSTPPGTPSPAPAEPRRKGVFAIFQPDPPAAHKVTDPAAIAAGYRRYQREILIATMIGYAVFYFVRKNLSIAMPRMEAELGITKASLGMFLTLHGLIYGVSKFVNGYLGDKSNARVFMVTGLLACMLLNVAFAAAPEMLGIHSKAQVTTALLWTFGVIWLLNGWFQGMGFPPCARLLTHWIPPKALATKMSWWNASHSIGAAAVAGLGAILFSETFNLGWEAMFYAPAGIALACAAYLWFTLHDTPESLGLPPVESLDGSTENTPPLPVKDEPPAELIEEELTTQSGYMKKVFTNPYIWIIALANFFVYTVRYAIFDWSPTIFKQAKGFDYSEANWITMTFEVAGIAGMLSAGWITDKVFGGRGARTCLFYMAACTAAVVALWKLPLHSGVQAASIMALAGFFIYGPQALVGIAVANLATKHAAATAVGLTGIFGYLSVVISGWGVGWMATHYGWTTTFAAICWFSALGTILFAMAWLAPAHGYKNQ